MGHMHFPSLPWTAGAYVLQILSLPKTIRITTRIGIEKTYFLPGIQVVWNDMMWPQKLILKFYVLEEIKY